MIVTNFDLFNEGFLDIDLKKIKEEAKKFSQTKECLKLFSKIDSKLLDSVLKELKKLQGKWGSIDNLSKKMLLKANSTNEGIASTIMVSIFGIHFFMKLLVSIKNNHGFLEFLGRLFWSDHYYPEFRTIRDIAIMITFIIYTIIYIVASNNYQDDYYEIRNGVYANLPYKWDGIHNYTIIDDYKKIYNIKRTSNGLFDVIYKGRKIGTTNCGDFYTLHNKKIMTDVERGYGIVKIDLEKILTGKYVSKEKEIREREVEIERLSKEIDSLNAKTYENVDIAKKIFRESGRDYEKVINTPSTEVFNLSLKERTFLYVKDFLTKGNNIGYLGLFTNLIFNDNASGEKLYVLYTQIKNNSDILNNIRDNNGNLCSLFSFNRLEALQDSLNRLSSWRKVNQFMRSIPSTQKSLIWRDGYFIDSLKDKSQFLTNAILKLVNNPTIARTFLSKISAAKDKETIIDSLYRVTNESPWDFDFWYKKLNNTRNVYISWSSKEKKQIICIVTSYRTIKKIAYMTNWCITRSASYFNDYSKNGFQCILYDFNYPPTSNISVIGFSLNDHEDKYRITDCHNKSDGNTKLPDEFLQSNRRYDRRGYIKPEFVYLNLSKLAIRFDKTFIKYLKNKFVRFLNRPYVASFIDYYDSD